MQWENNVSYFSSSIEYETFLLYVEVCLKSPKSLFLKKERILNLRGLYSLKLLLSFRSL